MYTLARFTALVLAASTVTAAPFDLVTRKEKPATYAEGYLENYQVYHTRYLALQCHEKHNTEFFDKCCHPMLAVETLEKNRAPECTPDPTAAAAAAAEEPTSTVEADDGTEEDCEDEEPETTPAAAVAAAPAPSPKEEPKKEEPKKEEPKKEEPKKEEQKQEAPKKEETPAPAPAPAKEDKKNDNNNNDGGNSNPIGDIIKGGHITFYDQNGNPGNCGEFHSDDELIAAIDTRRYGGGELCGKKVQITNKDNGNQVTVTIKDSCPTCDNNNSIDLSRAAFKALAPFSVGLLTNVEWHFV